MNHIRKRTGFVVFLFAATTALGQSLPAPEGMKERANLRNVRYCEVLVVTGSMLSAKAAVYNTLGLNDCPASQWASLDPNKLKKELHAMRVVLNGPRYFIMDRNALRSPGAVQTFDGLQARLLAYVEVHRGTEKRTPYTENTIERQSQYVYEGGKNVYELLAPGGHNYIMQSYSVEVDKGLNELALTSLGDRLKVPKGWQYRVRKLDQDIVVKNSGSTAYVVQDDFKNTYQRMN